jgi:hypothetical protein
VITHTVESNVSIKWRRLKMTVKELTKVDGEVTPCTSTACAESKHEVEGGRICLSQGRNVGVQGGQGTTCPIGFRNVPTRHDDLK